METDDESNTSRITTNNHEQMHQDSDNKCDSISCLEQMAANSDCLHREAGNISNLSNIIADEDDPLEPATNLMADSTQLLQSAGEICQSLTTGIQNLAKAIKITQEAIIHKKDDLLRLAGEVRPKISEMVVMVDEQTATTCDKSHSVSSQSKLLAKLHKLEKLSETVMERGKEVEQASIQLASYTDEIKEIVNMTKEDVRSVVNDVFDEALQKMLATSQTIQDEAIELSCRAETIAKNTKVCIQQSISRTKSPQDTNLSQSESSSDHIDLTSCLDEIESACREALEKKTKIADTTSRVQLAGLQPQSFNQLNEGNRDLDKALKDKEDLNAIVDKLEDLNKKANNQIRAMESKHEGAIKAFKERLLKSIEEATAHHILSDHEQELQQLLNAIRCHLPLNTKEQVPDDDLSDECPEEMVAVEKLLHDCTQEINRYKHLENHVHETIGKSKSVNHLYLDQLEDIEREFDHIFTTLKSLSAKCQESITTSKEILERLQLQKMIKCSESLLVAADKVLVNLGQLSSVDDEIESAESAIQTCGQDTKEVQMAIEDVLDIIARLSQAKKDANDSEGTVRENKEKLSATLGIAKPNVGDIAETKDTLARNLEMLEQLCDGIQKDRTNLSSALDDMRKKNTDAFRMRIFRRDDTDGLICVVRAPDGVLDDIQIQCSPETENITTKPHQFTCSDAITLEPKGKKLSKDILVAIPYDSTQTNKCRDIIVQEKDVNGRLSHHPTNSTWKTFNNYPDMVFVEIQVKTLSTFVVLSQLKQARYTFDSEGGNITLPVDDHQVEVEYPRGTIHRDVEVSLEVESLEENSFTQLCGRRTESWGTKLVSISPMIYTNFAKKPTLQGKFIVRCPLPSIASIGAIRIAGQLQGQSWQDVHASSSNLTRTHEGVQVELTNPLNKLLFLNTHQNEDTLLPAKVADDIEKWTETTLVNFIFFHQTGDKRQIALQIVPQDKCQKTVENLRRDGYVGPPAPSNECELREKQEVIVKLSDNLKFQDRKIRLTFYRGRSNRVQFRIKGADEDGIRLNMGGGAIDGNVEFHVRDPESSTQKELERLPIRIPAMPEWSNKKKNSGQGVSDVNLRDIAKMVGRHYRELGLYLKLTDAEIDCITNDHKYMEDQIFGILIKWRNRCTGDKEKVLQTALEKCGLLNVVEKFLSQNGAQ